MRLRLTWKSGEMIYLFKVNIGAGSEKLEGWIAADLPVGEQSMKKQRKPGVVVDVDNLPLIFEDNSVDAFRMRDVIIETGHPLGYVGEPEREHWVEFAKEILRCLKPGGLFILIEHQGYHEPFDGVLNLVTREPGSIPNYIELEEVKDEIDGYRFWISIYQKECYD